MNFFLRISSILFIFLISIDSFALDQKEKLWFAINFQQILSNDKKWHSFIYSQLRFTNESHPWKTGLLEGGIGYHFITDSSIWLGYRWTGRNPYNGFNQENRLFQQLIYETKFINSDRVISRTRLEEIQLSNSNQISLRLRERLAFELKHECFLKAFPFLYDEIFFQLKNTNYTSNKLISENRIFIGFNIFTSDKIWWEVGYINQFQLRRPQENQNTMSHIISFTYNFS